MSFRASDSNKKAKGGAGSNFIKAPHRESQAVDKKLRDPKAIARRAARGATISNFMVVVVLVDTICTIADIDARADSGETAPAIVILADVCLALYTLEMTVTLWLRGLRTLKELTTQLDVLIIGCGVVEKALNLIWGQEDNTIISLIRVLRLVRIFRITRLLQRTKALRELSKLVSMMATCLKALVWSFIFCFVIMTVWAMLMVEFIYPLILELSEDGTFGNCPQCTRATSSVMSANVLLFKTVIAGDSWGEIAVPVIEKFPWTAIVFMGSLLTLVFGVLNLIVAVVVDTFAEARQRDVLNLAEDLEVDLANDQKVLQKMFERMDEDGSGLVSFEELVAGARKDPEFQSRLRVNFVVFTAELRSQWGSHSRWVSLNGCVSPTPLRNAKGIPQGDPWSPAALTLVLGCVSRQQKLQVPAATTLLYLDDRSILAPDLQSLQNAMTCWSNLEHITRMRTNNTKTQFIARTSEALHEFQNAGFNVSKSGTILGCTLGMLPRPPSQQEEKQKAEVARIAPRISRLPVKLRFRAQVASYTLTSKMSWGTLFSGRCPDVPWFQKQFKTAVSGSYKNTRASVELTRFYLWGHRSDLGFVACLNLLKALTRWKAVRPDVQWNMRSTMFQALQTSLSKLQCQVHNSGIVSWPLGWWDLKSPPGFCDQFSHNFRVHWRRIQLNQWLSSSRNDALIARNQGLRFCTRLVDRLHSQSLKVSGDEIAVMTGGLLTHVHLNRDANICQLCENAYPDTDHLYWHCSFFRDIRSLPKPIDPMVARLGWNQDIHFPILAQMAKIRARAAEVNRQNLVAAARGGAAAPELA